MIPLDDPNIPDLDWTPEFDLSKSTSMGLPCVAAAMATADSDEALVAFLRLSQREHWRVQMLGGGSNTIFCSPEFDGIALRLGRPYSKIKVESERLTAGGSALLSAAVRRAHESALSGLEFGIGIPGQIGGALAGNAGQRGEWICSLVETVWGYDWRGNPFCFGPREFEHGYRHSELSKYIVTGATFVLKTSEPSAIDRKMKQFLSVRWEQPMGVRSSGCVFKNPDGDSAGRLIDKAGFKGRRVGGAQVAREHANFVLNQGDATAGDLKALIEQARDEVRARFGIELELEVHLVE